MSLFRHAIFHASAAAIADLPLSDAPEIAFAGRSNAGKSSAINALLDHKRLAFVSKNPGRTQLINYFRLRAGGYIVDLPGYGYADVPEHVRQQWQTMIEHYLTRRPNLAGVFLIMDARHPLRPLDRQLIEWFLPKGRPIHALLGKADKLGRSAAGATLLSVRRSLQEFAPLVSVQLFSSVARVGLEQATEQIHAWLSGHVASARKRKAPG